MFSQSVTKYGSLRVDLFHFPNFDLDVLSHFVSIFPV